MTPTLLAYQIDPKKLGKMQIVCLRLGIRVQAVDPADFGQTIGALAGVLPREPDAPAAVTQPLSYSMLLLHRLGDAAFSVYPLLTQLPSTYTDR